MGESLNRLRRIEPWPPVMGDVQRGPQGNERVIANPRNTNDNNADQENSKNAEKPQQPNIPQHEQGV